MSIRVAINGLGRIGRAILRIGLECDWLDFALVNDLVPSETLAHMLKYDSTYGPLEHDVELTDGFEIQIGGTMVEYTSVADPKDLPHGERNIDVVVESSGRFTSRDVASKHLQAGADYVLITAPAREPDVTVCMGVNREVFDPQKHRIISMSSCTVNCLAPVLAVLENQFGIEHCLATSLHAYMADQPLLDVAHSDPRRARAGALSMIPTTTGAGRGLSEVLPHLGGKADVWGIRVPTPIVSLVDIVAQLEQPTGSGSDIGDAMRHAATTQQLYGILACNDLPLASVDFKGSTHSAIVDMNSIMVVGDRMVKAAAWHDNEIGYASRIIDMLHLISQECDP